MISSVSGKVGRIAEGLVEIRTAAGLGYELGVPAPVLQQLSTAGEDEVTLITHLVVRDDAMELFGFSNVAQRTLFRRLIALNGVGPRSALSLMSALGEEEFFAAIAAGDEKALTQAQGIGAKTARRIISELRDSLPPPEGEVGSAAAQARKALEGLSFSATEAADLVRRAAADGAGEDVDTLLRRALQLAGSGRLGGVT